MFTLTPKQKEVQHLFVFIIFFLIIALAASGVFIYLWLNEKNKLESLTIKDEQLNTQIASLQQANSELTPYVSSYGDLLDFYTIQSDSEQSRVLIGTRRYNDGFLRYLNTNEIIPQRDFSYAVIKLISQDDKDKFVQTNSNIFLRFDSLDTFFKVGDDVAVNSESQPLIDSFKDSAATTVELLSNGLKADEASLFKLMPIKFNNEMNEVLFPRDNNTMKLKDLIDDSTIRRVNVNDAYVLYHNQTGMFLGARLNQTEGNQMFVVSGEADITFENYLDVYFSCSWGNYSSRSAQTNPSAFLI